MIKRAIIFPGQGSQSVAMMSELYDAFLVVRDTYAEANEALGFDLWALTSDGPKETLDQTKNTQPAMLVAGVACYRALQNQIDFTPDYFAGHSLGEYTALVASGQLGFVDAVKLSRQRAEAMQAAIPAGIGAMAAILGLDFTTIQNICEDLSDDQNKVWAANDNAPGQTVIAGHHPAVEKACDALKAIGAKRALTLPVSVPSHCPLMQPAADAMNTAFHSITWCAALAPVIHNVDVLTHNQDDAIIMALTEQLIKPVRWVETIQYLSSQGVSEIIEAGPGKVLSGLTRRIDKQLISKPLFDVTTLNDVVTLLTQQ